MLANLQSRRDQVVDARDAARFGGETMDAVHGLPSGHIPGARNLHFRALLNEDGTFKSPSDLRAAFSLTRERAPDNLELKALSLELDQLKAAPGRR